MKTLPWIALSVLALASCQPAPTHSGARPGDKLEVQFSSVINRPHTAECAVIIRRFYTRPAEGLIESIHSFPSGSVIDALWIDIYRCDARAVTVQQTLSVRSENDFEVGGWDAAGDLYIIVRSPNRGDGRPRKEKYFRVPGAGAPEDEASLPSGLEPKPLPPGWYTSAADGMECRSSLQNTITCREGSETHDYFKLDPDGKLVPARLPEQTPAVTGPALLPIPAAEGPVPQQIDDAIALFHQRTAGGQRLTDESEIATLVRAGAFVNGDADTPGLSFESRRKAQELFGGVILNPAYAGTVGRALLTLMEDPNPLVAHAIQRTILYQPDNRDVITGLVAKLDGPKPQLAGGLLDQLFTKGPPPSDLVPTLVPRIRRFFAAPSAEVRWVAYTLAGDLRKDGDSLVPDMTNNEGDLSDSSTRFVIKSALKKIGTPAAREAESKVRQRDL